MKQRPCFLSMPFLSQHSLLICGAFTKVHVIPCPSEANNALEVVGGDLGGCFLSCVVGGVVAIELHLSRASTSVLSTLSNSSRLQFPVSNSLLIINLSSWGTLLRRTGTSKQPYGKTN